MAPRWFPSSPSLPAAASLPAALKPRATVVGEDDGTFRTFEVLRVEDVDELRRALARFPQDEAWLVQRWIEGSLAAVCGVAWNGDVVCACHQVSQRIWPTDTGISSYATTVPRDAELEDRVRALVRAIGWSGVFGVQFLRAGDRAYVLDVNPRIYGSIGLAIAAGLNLPAIWVDVLLGREPRVGAYRAGVHYRVGENDVRALAQLFRAGHRRDAIAGLLPRPRTVGATFSLRDPGPTLATVARAVAAARR